MMHRPSRRKTYLTVIITAAATLLTRQFVYDINSHTRIVEPNDLTALRHVLTLMGFDLWEEPSGLVLSAFRFTAIHEPGQFLLVCTPDAIGVIEEQEEAIGEDAYAGIRLAEGTILADQLASMDFDGQWLFDDARHRVRATRLRRGDERLLVIEVEHWRGPPNP